MPVFDRHHRDGVCPFRTQVFVPVTHRPGPLCSEHSGSAYALEGWLGSIDKRSRLKIDASHPARTRPWTAGAGRSIYLVQSVGAPDREEPDP